MMSLMRDDVEGIMMDVATGVRPLAIQSDFATSRIYICVLLLGQHQGEGGYNFKGILFYGWLPRRWIFGVPASTLAAVLATVLAAIRGELRDLWDPAGEHRLHTHNHPLPSEQTPNLNLFYFYFFLFISLSFLLCFRLRSGFVTS